MNRPKFGGDRDRHQFGMDGGNKPKKEEDRSDTAKKPISWQTSPDSPDSESGRLVLDTPASPESPKDEDEEESLETPASPEESVTTPGMATNSSFFCFLFVRKH